MMEYEVAVYGPLRMAEVGPRSQPTTSRQVNQGPICRSKFWCCRTTVLNVCACLERLGFSSSDAYLVCWPMVVVCYHFQRYGHSSGLGYGSRLPMAAHDRSCPCPSARLPMTNVCTSSRGRSATRSVLAPTSEHFIHENYRGT